MTNDDVMGIRAIVSNFSKDRPLFLPRTLYVAISKDERLSDVMDRVREIRPLTHIGTNK